MNNTPTTFTKILNGISTTLNFANRALPLYQESKPLIKTVKDTYKNIKKNKDTLGNLIKIMKANKTIQKENNIQVKNINIDNSNTFKSKQNINNPTFFI